MHFVTIASVIFENANTDVDSKCEWTLSIRESFRTQFIDWGISQSYYYRPQICEGYVFTRVCLSTLGVWSRGVPGPGGLLPGGWRPPVTVTAAGGTHPTGMHSYLLEGRVSTKY